VRAVLFSLAISITTVAPAAGATLHTDTFDADVQGWVTGGGLVSYQSTGGTPGGFVAMDSFTHLALFNNDERWTGDFAVIGATQVTVDLMAPLPADGAPTSPLEMRVVLFGEGEPRGADRWTSAVAQMVPNDGVWRTYTFSLAEADLAKPGNPTAVYADIISGVGRLMFRHDAGQPNHTLDDGTDSVTGRLGIDNAQLAAASAPIAGDFNGDMNVDADDLNDPVDGWRVRFGNDLDGQAFLDWQRNLGAGATTTAAAQLPEPGTLALGFAAAAFVMSRRHTMSAMQ
jgi:hypothetical protein